MRTTSLGLVVALLVLGGALGWSGVALLESSGTVSAAPWSASAGLGFFAALLFTGAWYMYDRVHRRGRGVDALLAVRLLVLGKASALVGAVVTGGYAGFGLRFATHLAPMEGRDKVWSAVAAAGAGLLVVIAALLLERACRVPKGRDEDEDDGGDGEEPEGTATSR